MSLGGKRPGSGRPAGSQSFATSKGDPRIRSETYRGIKKRIKELGKRPFEDAKREKARLELALLPFDEPKLQAMEVHTTHDLGDSLLRWMKTIDGETTGIARGTPYRGQALAFEPPLLDAVEVGDGDSVQTELDATDATE
jgi:hypothetical protein